MIFDLKKKKIKIYDDETINKPHRFG